MTNSISALELDLRRLLLGNASSMSFADLQRLIYSVAAWACLGGHGI
jgi:hypothetical protein